MVCLLCLGDRPEAKGMVHGHAVQAAEQTSLVSAPALPASQSAQDDAAGQPRTASRKSTRKGRGCKAVSRSMALDTPGGAVAGGSSMH